MGLGDAWRGITTKRRVLVSALGVVLAGSAAAGALLAAGPPARPTTAAATTPSTKTAHSTTTASSAPATRKDTAAATPCAGAMAGWSVPRLLAQLLMLTGTFTHPGTLVPATAAGVGALEMAFAPGVEPSTTPATWTRVHDVIASLVSDAASAGQLAPLVSTDEEGGLVTRLGGVLGALPPPREMATEWSTTHVEQVMAARGAQMKALGVGMDTGPVYDTAPGPSYEDARSFSTSPTVVAAYAGAFAKGLASAGVLAVAKHFPGEGHASADTDTGVATDPPIATLRAHDLFSFVKAIATGVPVVMVGHPIVPGLTDGIPASISSATYTLLRRTLGFTGLAITDTVAVKALSIPGYSAPEAVVLAVEAGADMPMVRAATWRPALSALEHAVTTGALSMQVVRTRVAHVLVAKGACTGSKSVTP